MGKRKPEHKPRKLTDFYPSTSTPRPQDGAEASDLRRGSPNNGNRRDPAPTRGASASLASNGGSSPGPSPVSSPQKSVQKRSTSHTYAGEQGDECDSRDSTRVFIEQINEFPTSGMPLSDTIMKEMLVTLRGSLHRDMMQCISQIKSDVTSIGDRVSHVEDKMGDYAVAHNELVDAHDEAEGEMQAMREKIADLEDRSRRNNVKLRGVEESVTPADLRRYVQHFIAAILPDIPDGEVIVDRAHRLPKPKFLPDSVPRDVIARIHFFHVKDDLMRFSRKNHPLPAPYSDISVYADLSQHTMLARKKLSSITKLLQNHKIPYSWGFPTKLLIVKDNRTLVIKSLEEGLALAKRWDLLPEGAQVLPTKQAPARMSPEWSTA